MLSERINQVPLPITPLDKKHSLPYGSNDRKTFDPEPPLPEPGGKTLFLFKTETFLVQGAYWFGHDPTLFVAVGFVIEGGRQVVGHVWSALLGDWNFWEVDLDDTEFVKWGNW